jgi:tripartite-type tricarboxylate transporter receptor subunit TctC
VVPSAGGSTTDTLARIMADQLSRIWGKPVIVENIGSGMVLGAAQVFRQSYQMPAHAYLASGFCGSNIIELRSPRGGYNSAGLRKFPDGAR